MGYSYPESCYPFEPYQENQIGYLFVSIPEYDPNDTGIGETVALPQKSPSRFDILTLHSLLTNIHPDNLFDNDQSNLLWICRDFLFSKPELLPTIAFHIDYKYKNQINIFHHLVANWPSISIETSLKVFTSFYFP